MAKVIIFGVQDFAELAHYYLTHDSPHEVIAFSVNEQYLPKEKQFHNLPVVPFEDIENTFSPNAYKFFAPMSPRKMNTLRESIYNQITQKKYEFISYVSSKATVLTDSIGDNCFILEDNTIQPFTVIGRDVILWSGNHIGHHSVIRDHVFFSSHVVLSGHCIVEPFCFFGVNSTVRDGVTLAEGSFIAMDTSIMKNTDPWGVYKGSPSKKVDIPSKELDF